MALGKLVKAAKEKQVTSAPLTVDLSEQLGEGATVSFRAPGVTDFFPSDAVRLRFAATFPTLMELASHILIMASCYIPDPSETGVSPVDEMANLAIDGRDVFIHVMKRFNAAFPVQAFQSEVDAAKNA